MRRLLLLRHAKAEAGAPDQDDHDRALTERGLADAAAVARYLKSQGYAAARILCSTSTRTRQTAEAVLRGTLTPVEWLEALYLAAPGKIVAMIQDAHDGDDVLMVVGHNPGLEQCATLLARDPVRPREQHRHDVMEEKFPTAALAVLDFDIASWKLVAPCSARLVDFMRPRDL
jgi:phosphohistidine phosphatase